MSSNGKSIDYQSLLKNAYTALEDMQARLETHEYAAREPVAIVGMGCRFPGEADNPEKFWQLLMDGVDAVTEVPPERWDVDEYYDPDPDAPGKSYTRWGTFLKEIDKFDADFFRISPREATEMDPQQRLLLEVMWQALEDAGLASKKITGSRAGVFIGVSTHDFLSMQAKLNDLNLLDAYVSTGASSSITAGRLSYFMDWHGPNLAIDTACSSSLMAAHLACQSLRLRECDMALAGGVNLMLMPEGTIIISRARMVSFDGRCKSFDASADGYVRGEGAGVVVLKRLSDAVANNDRILGVILGSASNQDGRSNGITAPNGLAQEQVIRAALANAGIQPGEVSYIEAHGTGTSLGDPIELRALDAVYGKEHSKQDPLYVGSVKTNIGHLEGAAGVAGLIKLVQSLQHKVIPPHLHFHDPNPLVPWDRIPVHIPTEPVEWSPSNGSRRVAGLSSFGFSGTNVHLIVAEAPQMEPKPAGVDRPFHLLGISAKNEAALKALAGRYARAIAENPETPLADLAFTANTGRHHFAERLAVLAQSSGQVQAQLSDWLSGGAPGGVFQGSAPGDSTPEVAFLFTGQGSQYTGMGRQLYETQPTFRKALDQCDEYLRPYLPRPLLAVLYPEDGADEDLIHQTAYTQPALFSIEYALAQLWYSWSIEAGVVLGHSVGEYVAACLAGVFSLKDGLKLIAARGRLMQELPSGGLMAAVFAPEERVAAAVRPYQAQVSIGAVNGPSNTVISGAGPAVQTILDELEAEGIKYKLLTVSHAFHSPLMDPMLDAFSEVASTISYSEPQIGLVSNVTGKLVSPQTVANADYWRNHVRAPVRFSDSIQTLGEQVYRLFLEIGPMPTLLGMGRRCLEEGESIWLPSLRPGREDWSQMLESLAALYTAGMNIDWDGFDRDYTRTRIPAPTYPFQRQRFWPELLTNYSKPAQRVNPPNTHPLLGQPLRSPVFEGTLFESSLATTSPAFLNDHRFFGTALFPATGFLEMGAAAGQALGAGAHMLEDVSIQEALILPEDKTCTVQAVVAPIDRDSARFQVYSLDENSSGSWKLHMTGKIRSNQPIERPVDLAPLAEIKKRCQQEVAVTDYYERIIALGAEYGPGFQGISGLWRRDGEALGYIELPETMERQAADYQIHPALLDACFQILGAAFPQAGDEEAGTNVYVPVGIESFQVYRTGRAQVWNQAVLRDRSEGRPGEAFSADLALFDEDGEVVARVTGLQLRKVSRADIWRAVQRRFDEWLYEVEWQPKKIEPPQEGREIAGAWLVFADRGGTGSRLAGLLEEAGGECLLVQPGAAYQVETDGKWQVDPSSSADFRRLLDEAASSREVPLLGAVYLWGLDAAPAPSLASLKTDLAQINGGALHLVQALADRIQTEPGRTPARVWLATRGTQPVGAAGIDITQASLWGLANTIAAEHPELHCTRLDFDPDPSADPAAHLYQEIAAPDGEDRVAWRGQERYAARFVRLKKKGRGLELPVNGPFELEIEQRGILDNLVIRPTKRKMPGPGEVEIRVKATGLNFRDVLNVLGMYPGPAGPVGTECSGIVVAAGEGVSEFSVGDEVIAMATGAFKSHVVAPIDLVYPKPPQFSFEKAASIPIAFLTAYYGLHNLARIQPGDRVLIHAAAGGVGIAAVQLAKRAGAEIYGTAGSPEKRSFLQSIGVHHVMSSRTLDFAGEIMQITNGEGVDIVLNALADEFIPKSLSVLADGGRFLEIGKRGIWDQSQVAELNPTLEYYVYDLTQVLLDDHSFARNTLSQLMDGFESGELAPLPLQTFPIEEVVEAFRFMAQARHIGKIVLTQEDDSAQTGSSQLREDAAYLITGGLGGLGLAISGEMIQHGARHLALMGRSAPGEAAREKIAGWEQAGAEVVIIQGDVSSPGDLANAIEQIEKRMPPLRGVVHAAGILHDGVLRQQTWERFESVLAPKVYGAWQLHELTRQKGLDFFVLFSSIASVLGSSGQGNYAAANAFLDALAHYRRAQGLPAMSINWGPWSEVGMAAAQRSREHHRWEAHGVISIAPEEGVQIFDRLLSKKKTQVSVYPADWSRLSKQLGEQEIQPLLRDLVRPQRGQDSNGQLAPEPKILPRILAAEPEDRRQLLLEHIQDQVIRVLGLDPSLPVDPLRGLTDLGMDSLMTVELINRLKLSLGRTLPTTLAFEYPTISALTDFLGAEVLSLVQPAQSQVEAGALQGSSEEIFVELEQMSDEEVEETLLQELDDIGY